MKKGNMMKLKDMVMGDMPMMKAKAKKQAKPWSSQNHAKKSGKKK